MSCQECKHKSGKCQYFCCCSIKQIGCPYCIVPIFGYRQVKKLIRKLRSKNKQSTVKKITVELKK